MAFFSVEEISQIINLPIIPVILLPVTGLTLLVFYNRAAAVNQRVRFMQKELRDSELEAQTDPRRKEMVALLKSEIRLLHSRVRKIAVTITCLLLSIFLFSLCAIFAVLSALYPGLLQIALAFWFFGPVLICIGVISALWELRQSIRTLSMQTHLIEKWGEEEI